MANLKIGKSRGFAWEQVVDYVAAVSYAMQMVLSNCNKAYKISCKFMLSSFICMDISTNTVWYPI